MLSYVRGGVIDALTLVRVFFGWHRWRGVCGVRCAEDTLAWETRVTCGTMNNMRFNNVYTDVLCAGSVCWMMVFFVLKVSLNPCKNFQTFNPGFHEFLNHD